MTARFDHTIIAAVDPGASAAFFRRLLEISDAPSWGSFTNLRMDTDESGHAVLLQFATPPIDFPPQHYAFRVDEAHFDRALSWLRETARDHWADPQRTRPGETNTGHDGRGVYLLDPAGHFIELLTGSYL